MTPSMILSHMRELKRIASSLYVGRQGGSVVCEVLFGSEALDCIGKAILWNGVEKADEVIVDSVEVNVGGSVCQLVVKLMVVGVIGGSPC